MVVLYCCVGEIMTDYTMQHTPISPVGSVLKVEMTA